MMGAFAVMKMDIRRIFRSPKLYLLLCFSLYFLMDFARDIKSYARIAGLGVAPYIYSFFYGNWQFRMFAMLMIIVLMSDAPYVDSSQKYTYIRTGDRKWLAGKVLFIIVISFLYQMLVMLLSVLVLLPDLGFSLEWGDVLSALANTTQSVTVSIGGGDSLAYILANYEPVPAMFLTFFLSSSVSIVVGLFIFFINGITKGMMGTALALVICMADLFVGLMRSYRISFSFPLVVSWMDLSSVYINERVTGKIFLGTVIFIMAAAGIVMTGMLYIAVRKKVIDISEE